MINTMKKRFRSLFAPLLLAIVFAGCAQAEPQGDPSTVSTEPQPGVPEGWVTDYAAALKQAKAEGKDVFIDFTGSDWCGWCIKLDKEVLDTAAFEKYAKENLVLVYLDFPRGKPQADALKEQNEKIAKQYGIRGFPTIVVLNSDGNKVGQMGYMKGGPDAFIPALEKLTSKDA